MTGKEIELATDEHTWTTDLSESFRVSAKICLPSRSLAKAGANLWLTFSLLLHVPSAKKRKMVPTATSLLRTTSSRGRLDFHLEAKAPDRFDVHRIECAAIVLQIALGRRLPLWQLAETAEFISGNIRSGKFAQSSDFARGRKTKLIEVHAQKMLWPEISPKIDSALICAHPILERGGRRLRFRSRRFQTEKE